jgi:hypothetical protein
MHWLSIALAVRGELPQAREAFVSLLGLAEARGDRPAALNAMRSIGLSYLLMGQIAEAYEWTERNVQELAASSEADRMAARAAGQDADAAGLAVMSWALWLLGYPAKAVARMGAALERADAIKDPHTQAYILLPEERAMTLAPEELRRRQLAALTNWVMAGAKVQPVVLAFEDLHWADPTTLDVLRGIAERGALAPLLIVATTRPEFRAPWGMRSNHGTISSAVGRRILGVTCAWQGDFAEAQANLLPRRLPTSPTQVGSLVRTDGRESSSRSRSRVRSIPRMLRARRTRSSTRPSSKYSVAMPQPPVTPRKP